MAGRIPQDFIDSLLTRSDIVEIIDERVPLKKAGREFETCCPFHGEKTPSFKVSPGKQFYHCFGCGAHGTVLGFLMDYERLEFREAIELLAERVGMSIPESARDAGSGADYRPIYEILERAADFYRQQLREHAQAHTAVSYLKNRGLTGEIARNFGMGFAPPGWDNLHAFLGQDKETVALMKTAGLAVDRNDGGTYDRFRNRIMFPIQDRRGRTIGFGGRVLADDTPKYLNSPETPVFHKGRELYGRWQAVRQSGKLEQLIVVEGYMDVVALAQHGITNAVASLGTAATPEHLESLFRLTPEVVFCFDGDAAGRRAAWRALENTLPQMRDGRRALFMFLPDGEDPDSLVRERGAEHFRKQVLSAANLSDYLFEHLSADLDLDSIEGQSRLYETGRPLLDQLPEGAFKTLAFRKLGQLSGVSVAPGTQPPSSTSRAAGAPNQSYHANSANSANSPNSRNSRHRGAERKPGTAQVSGSLVRRAIALLLHQPDAVGQISELAELREIQKPGIDLLVSLIEILHEHPNLSSGAVIERFRDDPMGKHLASLMAVPLALEEGLEEELRDSIRSLLAEGSREKDAARLRALTVKGSQALSDAEKIELVELTRAGRG